MWRSLVRSARVQRQALRHVHYVHNYQVPQRKWPRRLGIAIGVLAAAGAVGYYFFPKHTFSPEVAELLRKGLIAESDKGEFNYKEAVEWYVRALGKAREQALSPVSDEYTGIQLKVGEMLERLGRTEEARGVYSEICSAYNLALTGNEVEDELRPHLVLKNLRVTIKLAELSMDHPEAVKVVLLAHLALAQDEVARRAGKQAPGIIKQTHGRETPGEVFTAEVADHSLKVSSSSGSLTVPVFPEAWEPFRDELFNARDLYVLVCLGTHDVATAVRTKLVLTEWMVHAGCPRPDVLMSQCNVAALLFLLSEQYEGEERRRENAAEKAEAGRLKLELVASAEQTYRSVVRGCKEVVAAERPLVDEVVALATYGLGVVMLHTGRLDEALGYLREARVRAKGSGYAELVEESERELEKLEKGLEAAKLEASREVGELQEESVRAVKQPVPEQ